MQERDDEFAAFVAGQGTQLLRLAALLCRDGESAQDLLQDVLEVVYLKWNRVAAAGDPAAYVRRMLANKSVDRWRRKKLLTIPLLSHHDPAAPTANHDHRDVLIAALRALPRRQRATVVLRFCEDMSEAQVAAALGCSVGTVKSATSRGLAQLRQQLGDQIPIEMEHRS